MPKKRYLNSKNYVNVKAQECLLGLVRSLSDSGLSSDDIGNIVMRSLFCCFSEALSIFLGRPFTKAVCEASADEITETLNRFFEKLPLGELYGKFAPLQKKLSPCVKSALVEMCRFNWLEVSPMIFGTIQLEIMAILNQNTSASHYTALDNVYKVIEPLFLDELKKDLAAAGSDNEQLRKFKSRISGLQFLDPASGTGNYLLVIFDELRRMDEQICAVTGDELTVSLKQFYGIELLPDSVALCKVTMAFMNRFSEVRFAAATGRSLPEVDFSAAGNIICGNSIRVDWKELLPPTERTYLVGNPPFVAKLSKSQQADMTYLRLSKSDYCAAWLVKAADYIKGSRAQVALIVTSSVVQGQQVSKIWRRIHGSGVVINFAYRPFEWESYLAVRVQANCVIVGFAMFSRPEKYIYTVREHDSISSYKTDYINSYLLPCNELFLDSDLPPEDRPRIHNGTFRDITPFHNVEYTEQSPEGFLVTGDNLITGRFTPINEQFYIPPATSIVIPRCSSHARKYIPVGFYENEQLCFASSVMHINTSDRFIFGMLCSYMHSVWTKCVCGRLTVSLRYSLLVYNNFPFPEVTAEQKEKIVSLAENILTVRNSLCRPLGELYSRQMPPSLEKAHMELDFFVDKLYSPRAFSSDAERIRLMFQMAKENEQNRQYNFGDYLRLLRKKKDLTAIEAAKKMGITQPALSDYENAKAVPSERKLKVIAEIYDADYDELLKRATVAHPEK